MNQSPQSCPQAPVSLHPQARSLCSAPLWQISAQILGRRRRRKRHSSSACLGTFLVCPCLRISAVSRAVHALRHSPRFCPPHPRCPPFRRQLALAPFVYRRPGLRADHIDLHPHLQLYPSFAFSSSPDSRENQVSRTSPASCFCTCLGSYSRRILRIPELPKSCLTLAPGADTCSCQFRQTLANFGLRFVNI